MILYVVGEQVKEPTDKRISQTIKKGGVMEPCTKEKDIDHICERMTNIEEAINGNWKPGMKAELIEIKLEQRSMNGLLSTMNTGLSGVMKFMVETQKAEALTDKIRMNTTNVVNIVITAIIGIAAVVVAIIIS